jgi:hypothetical protein
MAWSINYRVHCLRTWSEDDRRLLRRHLEKWNRKLSPTCGPYDLAQLPAHGDFMGVTKPPPDPRCVWDYPTVVRALRELQKLFTDAEVWVSDDYLMTTPTDPGDVDLRALDRALRKQWGAPPRKPRAASDEDPEAELEALEAELMGEEPEHARLYREHQLNAARPGLERARADFEIWKRAQEKKKS